MPQQFMQLLVSVQQSMSVDDLFSGDLSFSDDFGSMGLSPPVGRGGPALYETHRLEERLAYRTGTKSSDPLSLSHLVDPGEPEILSDSDPALGAPSTDQFLSNITNSRPTRAGFPDLDTTPGDQILSNVGNARTTRAGFPALDDTGIARPTRAGFPALDDTGIARPTRAGFPALDDGDNASCSTRAGFPALDDAVETVSPPVKPVKTSRLAAFMAMDESEDELPAAIGKVEDPEASRKMPEELEPRSYLTSKESSVEVSVGVRVQNGDIPHPMHGHATNQVLHCRPCLSTPQTIAMAPYADVLLAAHLFR